MVPILAGARRAEVAVEEDEAGIVVAACLELGAGGVIDCLCLPC